MSTYDRSSRLQMLFKTGDLENSVKLIKKHLCFLWNLGVSYEFSGIFKNTLFYKTPLVASSGNDKQNFSLRLFIWEAGRNKKQGETIFVPPLYEDFFNRDVSTRQDWMISVSPFRKWLLKLFFQIQYPSLTQAF